MVSFSRLLRAVLGGAIASLGLLSASPTHAIDNTERWRQITGGTGVHPHGFATGDFDDDGRSDFAASVAGPTLIVHIEGVTNGVWGSKQILVAPADPETRQIPVAWPGPGPDRLVMVGNSGETVVYGGWPLAEIRRFEIEPTASTADIGDVDGNGVAELVVVTQTRVEAYDLESGELRWGAPYGGADVKLAQLDTDAALEVILASTPGIVLDGATRAVEWNYAYGFGSYLATGRFGADDATWFAGVGDWNTAGVFRASPWSLVWIYRGNEFDAVDSCDVDSDGRDELLLADGQFGSLHVIDPATHVDETTIPHSESGSNGIAAEDFNGDGVCDIAISPAGGYGAKFFRVFDSVGGTLQHDRSRLAGSILSTALGDLDGNGTQELVLATTDPTTDLRVVDAVSGQLLWELAPILDNAHDAMYLSTRRVLLGQVDADPALEIVLVGTSVSGGRVTVIDSGTHSVQRQIGAYYRGPIDHRRAVDAKLLDFDHDGALDVVVATQASSSSASGAKLHVFALEDGATLWESVAMGTGYSSIKGVLVAQSDADAASELVAVLWNGLRAFDADTRLLDWSLDLPGSLEAAAYDPVSNEIAVATGTSVRIYAASTRAMLTNFSADADVASMVPMPGADRQWIVYAGSQFVLFDRVRRRRAGGSQWMGPMLAGMQSDATTIDGKRVVASATSLGYFLHEFGEDPGIFASGLEP